MLTPSQINAEPHAATTVLQDDARILRVAVFSDGTTPTKLLASLFSDAPWCECGSASRNEIEESSFARTFDAAIVVDHGEGAPDKPGPRYAEQELLLELLRRQRLGTLILTQRPWMFAGYGFGTVCLRHDETLDTARGVLLALSRSQPVMRLIDKQVDSIRRLSENLSKQFEETQTELKLASRLQQEFLPKSMPEGAPIRFATVYRPCSWVSGDIYDIFRLDERHWGFSLADAMGHGVAAGLLTMYIKHAMQTKRIQGDSYELIRPAEVLSALNKRLVAQGLSDSQFITGWYGMINAETLELSYANAGHPPALHIRKNGDISELHGEGCILGLLSDLKYSDETRQLERGDRLVVYSDGLEPLLIKHRPSLPQMPELYDDAVEALRLPFDQLTPRLHALVDAAPGSLSRADDVTVVVMEVIVD